MTDIAGIPATAEPRGLAVPIGAVAIVKGLGDDGELRHWVIRAGDVTTVEGLGMIGAADVMYRNAIGRAGQL